MATGRINKRSADAAVNDHTGSFLWDDEVRGFGLRVSKAGARSYVFQYRLGGREARARRYTIGTHGSPWTAETARVEARRLSMMVAHGVDPIDADVERRRQAVDLAFASYVELFAARYLATRWKRAEAARRLLVQHAVPILRQKPLPQIHRRDLLPLWDLLASKPATAKLMHSTLRKLFRWACERGDLDRSPLEGVAAPVSVATRDRVLDDKELATVWNATEGLGVLFSALFRIMILTGQRRDEVAGLRWAELERSTARWTLPSHRSKNREASIVPISLDVIELLDKYAGSDFWPKDGLVFTTTGNNPPSGFSRAKARLDQLVAQRWPVEQGFEPWRLHDLRRTMATGLQRIGTRFEVTEAILNHVSGSRGGVAGIYQRYNWLDEKGEALTLWSRHVLSAAAAELITA